MPQILFADYSPFALGYRWVAECLKRGIYFSARHNRFLSAARGERESADMLQATDEAFASRRRTRRGLNPSHRRTELGSK